MRRTEISFANIFIILLIVQFSITKSTPNIKADRFAISPYYRENDELSELLTSAADYQPVDLGQGYPNFHPPQFLRETLTNISLDSDPLLNQYARASGLPRFVNALSKLYSKVLNRDLNPLDNFVVTIGASEAQFLVLQSTTSPGDEWIIFQPFFELGALWSTARLSGATIRYIALKPTKTDGILTSADWKFDKEELKSLFNKKTKGIMINNPNNPTGKVFTLEELQFIADLAKKWNTLVVSDEVYEWLVYSPFKHQRIAALPGMFERTITLCSASKTFSVTGWRIGWAYGPANVINNMKVVHFKTVYTNPTPFQEALATFLEVEYDNFGYPGSHLIDYPKSLVPKRDFMINTILDVDMIPTIPQSGYFVTANWSTIAHKLNLEEETHKYKDFKFASWLYKNVGVLGIPLSVFYGDGYKEYGADFIRLCFVKKDETLSEARSALIQWYRQATSTDEDYCDED